MEFLATNTVTAPKNLYPCTATITINPATNDKTRRMSTSSSNQGGEEDNALKRIVSGGRRKSDASQRRKSFMAGQSGGEGNTISAAALAGTGVKDRGTWYWRVQAGVTDNALVLLPLTQPANPLLTSPPMPLSQAMPAHSAATPGQTKASGAQDEGLVDKMKNLFRRGSAAPTHSDKDIPHPDPATAKDGDKVIDQTAAGEQLPSAKANATGATNVNANAETGWPGVIDGQKLELVAVPLHAIEKGKVGHGGGKKGDAYHIHVPVNSHFAAMIAGLGDSGPKSGSIRLEFDKDWIGAKAESELLHHHLTTALEGERNPPSNSAFQLGGQNRGAATNTGAAATGAGVTGSPKQSAQGHFGAPDPVATSNTAPHISERRAPSPTHIDVQSKLPSGFLGETTTSGHGIAGTAVGTGTVPGLDVESAESGRKVPGN